MNASNVLWLRGNKSQQGYLQIESDRNEGKKEMLSLCFENENSTTRGRGGFCWMYKEMKILDGGVKIAGEEIQFVFLAHKFPFQR